ncbi:MAG: PAS domain-containing protein [Actinomycetota bacterium]
MSERTQPGVPVDAQTLVERLPGIVYAAEFGEAGIWTYVSPRIESIMGYTAEEWLADPTLFDRRLHADDIERYRAAELESQERGESLSVEYRLRARDGHEVWIRDEAAMVPGGDGAAFNLGVMLDISLRKRTEAGLHEAEEKYRTLVEQIPAVTYIDQVPPDDPTDLSPVYISPQIEALLGYSPQEWLQDHDLWTQVAHPDDIEAVGAKASLAFQAGTPLSVEYRMITRDRRVVWVREEASLLRDKDGAPTFWQGVYIDITELKRAENELSRALRREMDASERLRALDEMKNTFLQAVSHDLRTPLAAILGLALTLEREDVELTDPEVRDLATRIASNSRKLDRMVADLLDLDRLTRGIIEPSLRDTDVGALVQRLVGEFEMPGDRRIILEAAQVVVPIDASKVERIVENLLINTVRHTPNGSRVWVKIEAHGTGAVISVEDEGPGVPEELREAVFDPFRQGPSISSHSPGAGVGLALVAKFSELHGGRAWVEPREGGGASFRVLLPGATPR